jgi:hypothetical protein
MKIKFHWLIGEILVGMLITLVSISFFQNASHHLFIYFSCDTLWVSNGYILWVPIGNHKKNK